jgi:uncharacterized membrane protein YeaQ/YmgE (transglycosylase-associated protein family)
MGWIIAIIVGALIGWLASLVMKTNEQQGCLLNVVIGIVGATLGRWIFADLLGIGGAARAGQFDLVGIIWGVLGAVVLIAILKALNVLK